MTTSTWTGEALGQMTGAAAEIFTLFADANQRVLRELVDLSAGAAKEGVRLHAELQSSAVEAVTDRTLSAAVRLFEDNVQAVTRSAERLQVSAERAGGEIQAAFAQLSTRMLSLYAPRA
jgi:hypothetical protein